MKTKIFLTSVLAVLVAGPTFADPVINYNDTAKDCIGTPIDNITEGAVQYRAVWHDCSVTGYESANISSLTTTNNGGDKCSYQIVCAAGYHLDDSVSSGTYTMTSPHTSITSTEWNSFCVVNNIELGWNTNGGEFDSSATVPNTCEYGKANDIPVVKPTKTGHTFQGWEIVMSGDHITCNATTHVCNCDTGYTLDTTTGKCVAE